MPLAWETGTAVWELQLSRHQWQGKGMSRRKSSLGQGCVRTRRLESDVMSSTLGHSLVFLKRPAGRVTHTMETAISCSPPSRASLPGAFALGHCAR